MADDRPDREERPSDPPAEGVRIIGAEEAAEALERGDVAQRRGTDQPRYGDRPTTPPVDGPRPVLRFPLASSDDVHDIQRAPVAPSAPPEAAELPHWTEPPSGQVPRIVGEADEASDDLDDWTAFTSGAPRWRDDSTGYDLGEGGFEFLSSPGSGEPGGALDESERPHYDEYLSFADLDQPRPGRSVFAEADQDPTVGTAFSGGPSGAAPDPSSSSTGAGEDPWDLRLQEWADSGGAGADVSSGGSRGTEPARRGSRRPVAPERRRRVPAGGAGGAGGPDRNLGQATAVGGALAAVALVLFAIGPTAAMLLVTVVVATAAAELFGALRHGGFHPLALPGIAGSAGAVIGAYNYGAQALPTVLFLTTAVCLLWYLVGAAVESPVLNVGVTLAGVLWVGMFGSFAALMLGLGDDGVGLLLAAVAPTIAYDVGGLAAGRRFGRSPLSAASPNKTVEGLIGGSGSALGVAALGAAAFGYGPVDSLAEGLLVGLVVAIAAPVGDLCESLVKRDIGVKDMGGSLPGHGGLLDRFDALLFVLPSVWMLASVKDFFV